MSDASDKIDEAVVKFYQTYRPQIVIVVVFSSILMAMAYCAKPAAPPEPPTVGDVEGIRAEIAVLKAEIEDYRRIRAEDQAIRTEIDNEVNQDLMNLHQKLDRRPQSTEGNWDVNVDGPIDGKYIVTLDYFGYTYQKIVDGDPNSPANVKILFKWESEKMEERDATLSRHKSTAQISGH